MKYYEDLIEFDSKLEYDHYLHLKEQDDIEILGVHQTFTIFDPMKYIDFPRLKLKTQRDIKYTPDFVFKLKGLDRPVAMESKGYARKEYMLRKKLFMLKYSQEYYFYQCNSLKKLKEDLERVRQLL
jgi:hypothetical protein